MIMMMRLMMTTTIMLMIVCTKTSLCFYLMYFICRWVIIELKKTTLKCKLATLQTEAYDIIVKTTSSLGRQGKVRGDSI